MQGSNVNCKDINPLQPPVTFYDSEVNKMRWTLTAITKEIQRFCHAEKNESQKFEGFELLDKIFKYKLRVKMKKKQIKRIKQNFKFCYILVKLLKSSKGKDSWNLTKKVLVERRMQVDLIKNHLTKVELVTKLSEESVCLEKKFKDIQNYICHVYNELPKKIIESSYNCDAPLLEKIKTIIFNYEQQRILLSTELAKCQLIEQKNRFLKNKINILECNIESFKDEIASHSYLLLKRDREILFYKNRLFNNISHAKVSVLKSPCKISNPDYTCNSDHKNLSSHLTLVNSLLTEQDSLINSIKVFFHHIYSIN